MRARKDLRVRRIAAAALVGGAAVALLAGCGRSVEASGDVGRGPAEGKAVEVVAKDNAFTPAALKLEPGKEVTVEVTNSGEQPHNFTVEALDLSTGTIEPGDVATATFTGPEDGVEFVCTLHPGMDGRLELAAAN